MTEDYTVVILNVESNYCGISRVGRTVEYLYLLLYIFILTNLFTAIFIHSRLDIYLSEDPLCRVIHSAVCKNIGEINISIYKHVCYTF